VRRACHLADIRTMIVSVEPGPASSTTSRAEGFDTPPVLLRFPWRPQDRLGTPVVERTLLRRAPSAFRPGGGRCMTRAPLSPTVVSGRAWTQARQGYACGMGQTVITHPLGPMAALGGAQNPGTVAEGWQGASVDVGFLRVRQPRFYSPRPKAEHSQTKCASHRLGRSQIAMPINDQTVAITGAATAE